MTESGWNNGFMMKKWLTECFDPYTKPCAGSNRQLLLIDGPKFHCSMEFIEACWSLDIICLLLPANLSAVFQPLDVDFFNHL